MADSAQLGGVLQDEIEKSRNRIKGYNENIKKLTGRDASVPGIRRFISDDSDGRGYDRAYGRDRGDGFSSVGRGGSFAFGRGGGRGRGGFSFGPPPRRIVTTEDDGPSVHRRTGGAFSRLGPAPGMRRTEREESPYKEELPNKLSVHSSVVSTSRENKNRKDVMEEQTKDSEGMQRNRRMFGLLLGTLNRFKTDSKASKTKEARRAEIDKKLEDKATKEKKAFQQETKLLVEEMKMEEAKVTRLQQKMEMLQEHDEREEEIKKLKNFIITKSKPKIFWKPREMSTLAEGKLKDSEKVVDKMLKDGRERLEKEVKELMDRESKREERIKQRLREDMDTDGDRKKGSDSQKEGKVSVTSMEDSTEGANEGDGPDSGKKRRRVVVKGEGQDSDDGMDETEADPQTTQKDLTKPQTDTNAGSDSDTDVEDVINESVKAPSLKIETEVVEEKSTNEQGVSVPKEEVNNPEEEDRVMDHEEYDDKLIQSKKKEIEKVLNEDANGDREEERKSRKKRESRHERDDSKDRSKRRKREKSSERENRRRRRSGSANKNEREERRRKDSDSKHRSRRDSDKDKSRKNEEDDESPKDKKDRKDPKERSKKERDNIEQDGSGDAKIKEGSGLIGENEDIEMESDQRD